MDYSKEFLFELDKQVQLEKYVKIIALDINENPIEQIEGRVTNGGAISIDGASAVRRTCSLTLLADLESNTITDEYWALSHKFKLEIGLSNNINPLYPEIIWINQGIFAISSFSASESVNNYTINIQGKDKMALLNGELGGLFSASTTLDTIEIVNKDDSITYEKQLIYEIIKNLLHLYCNEPINNIIINDLPDYAYELLDYIGSSENNNELPLYYFREATNPLDIEKYKKIINMSLDGDKIVYLPPLPDNQNITNGTSIIRTNSISNDYTTKIKTVDQDQHTSTLGKDQFWSLNNLPESLLFKKVNNVFETGKSFALKENAERKYFIQKVNFGETAGYHRTKLIYPGDLVANAGEAVTSVLDKIKNILGDFEYFYDTDGKFIFQKKKSYVNNLFTPIIGSIVDPFVEVNKYSYEFEDKSLIVSMNYSPNLSEVKNDFSIWGAIKSQSDGQDIPVLARYAIDEKPKKYTTFPYYIKKYEYTFLREQGISIYLEASLDEINENNIRTQGWPYANEEKWVKRERKNDEGILEKYYASVGVIGNESSSFDYIKKNDYYVKEEGNVIYNLSFNNIKDSTSENKIEIELYQNSSVDITEEKNYYIGSLSKKTVEEKDGENIEKIRVLQISLIPEENLTAFCFITTKGENMNDLLLNLKSGTKLTLKESNNNDNGNTVLTFTPCINNQIYEIKNEEQLIIPLTNTFQQYYVKENGYFVHKDNYILSNLNESNLILDEIYYLKEDTTTYVSLEYYNSLPEEEKEKYKAVDWRELIWLMQRDYYQHNTEKDFKITLQNLNELSIEGKTGYEHYYADMQGFWRQLYDPEGDAETYIKSNSIEAHYGLLNWNRQAVYYPETLKFWFDFLDSSGPISNYSVKKIGQRQKIDQASNNGVRAIFYSDTPDVEFIILPQESKSSLTVDFDKTVMYIQDYQQVLFKISSRGKDSSKRADELIWKHACGSENITINCLPIHTLEPNTRIKLLGEDYIINKITLPITHNGTMQITASKVINPI